MSSMEESDAAAVSRARAGDSDAFRVLVERHSRNIFRLAYRMTGSEQDAEDVVQESFFKAFRQLKGFEERANFGTWLYRITANCALDLMRKRKRHDEIHEKDEPDYERGVPNMEMRSATPDGLLLGIEVRQQVHAALGALSPMERSAFVLRHFEGMSIEEVGRALGLRTSAAKHSIFRAVRKMRGALEPLMSTIR
jgi:RNA polymerase sigma-70 factor (ECF subfamily)